MYTKFAAALLASFTVGKGSNDGSDRENAFTYILSNFDADWSIKVHLYNKGADIDEHQIHGDVEV